MTHGGMAVSKVTEHCSYLFLASAGVPHGEGSEVSCVRQGGTCSARLHRGAHTHTHTHTAVQMGQTEEEQPEVKGRQREREKKGRGC